MRLHSLEHVPFEDAANIAAWARSRGHAVSRTRLYAGEPLPAKDAFDWLAVMGGPMSVHDEEEHPWLAPEKAFIARAIHEGRTVLGVCLGAQLAAEVLGAAVEPTPEKEIGWFPVRLAPEAEGEPLFAAFPPEFTPFHWHGDGFDLPAGAVRIAGTDVCHNQAFVWGRRVVGLQFHLDYSMESIRKMVAGCADELVGGPFIQTPGEMLADPGRVAGIRRLLDSLLDALAERR